MEKENAQDVFSRLNIILKIVKPFDQRKFFKIGSSWIYEEPLIATKNHMFFTVASEPIRTINLPEQIIFHKLLGEYYGINQELGHWKNIIELERK